MSDNTIRSMLNTTPASPESSDQSPETLKQVEAVLDYIRSNLKNIEATWGVGSPQYISATQIMDQYLTENIRKLNVRRSDLDDLMQKMSLEDSKS